ncbi:MAG TPA: TIGR03435 family protein [Bryobacteraceae bacterium]|nr:TIGR03435 family protein [Bryobacteraceae bacterium]
MKALRSPVSLALTAVAAMPMTSMHAQQSNDGQTTSALVYEVASVKPSNPQNARSVIMVRRDDSRLTVTGITLKFLIQFAYGHEQALAADLVVGGPPWYDTARYDIEAKPAGHRIPSKEEHRQMLRALLADRFRVSVHTESRQMALFALVADKNGPKMKPHQAEDAGEHRGIGPGWSDGGERVSCRDVSMDALASFLESTVFKSPVRNQTGLEGSFDFDLNWTPDETQFGGRYKGASPGELPDLRSALREQLGLRLRPEKAPVDVIVVDHAERPSGN